MSIPVALGAAIPLQVQLATSRTTLFARAFLFDATGAPLNGGTPIVLSQTQNGLYQDFSFLMPNTAFVVASYQIALDAAFTSVAPQDGSGIDVFDLQQEAAGVVRRDELIAVVDDSVDIINAFICADVLTAVIEDEPSLATCVRSDDVKGTVQDEPDLVGVIKCQ